MDRSYQSKTGHAFGLICHRFFFLERGQSGAVYGDGLITANGTLLQVLEEAPLRLRLPAYLDAIAPDAFEKCKEITLIGHHIRQVKSWKPLLKAKKCMLYLECEQMEEGGAVLKADGGAESLCSAKYEMSATLSSESYAAAATICSESYAAAETKSSRKVLSEKTGFSANPGTFNTICLYFSSVEGFDDVFSADGVIDFDAYDRRFARVRDQECKLLMALARILYPYKLSEKARSDYEALLKKRSFPAQTLLVSGSFDRYGLLPERWQEVMNLKKPEKYIARELVRMASENGQDRWVEVLLSDPNPGQIPGKEDGTVYGAKASKLLFEKTSAIFIARCPELSGCLAAQYEKISSLFRASLTKSCKDPVRLLAHILFHELFGVWGMEKQGIVTFSNEKEARLFSLAAEIAAEYQVDEYLGYEPDKAWYRQLVYDTIKRNYQLPGLFKKHPGVRFLTVREAYAYVTDIENGYESLGNSSEYIENNFTNPGNSSESPRNSSENLGNSSENLGNSSENRRNSRYAQGSAKGGITFSLGNPADYPRTTAELEKLFTVGDVHPAISVDYSGTIGGKRHVLLTADDRSNEIGQGLPDDSGKSKRKGLRSSGISSEKDSVGEEGSLVKREGHDYKSFLKQFMVSGETRTLDLDSFDPVYYTLGLDRYGDMPFVEPLETKEVLRLNELVIVIDTSGSCSGPMVRFFLEETWSVFRQQENFFDRFHVHILQCDAMVQQDTRLTTLEEAEQYMKGIMIHGGGNTDFRPAFRYIKGLQRKGELRRLKGIIYFTDGFGTFPKKGDAPACKTVFVSLRKQFDQVEVPVWAERLLLEPPKGADWATAYTGAFQSNIY